MCDAAARFFEAALSRKNGPRLSPPPCGEMLLLQGGWAFSRLESLRGMGRSDTFSDQLN